MAHTLINIGSAQLTVQQFPDEQLVDDCVRECVDCETPLLTKKPRIFIYGRESHQQRNVGFFREFDPTIPGDDVIKGYHYSHQVMPAQQFTPSLKKLLDEVNSIYEAQFNSVLINEYENGLNEIHAHCDDEVGIDPIAGVVAISWGAVRIFRIKTKNSGENKAVKVLDVPTTPYGLIQMSGNFQEVFTHEIPIQKKVLGPRVSFTFRRFD